MMGSFKIGFYVGDGFARGALAMTPSGVLNCRLSFV